MRRGKFILLAALGISIAGCGTAATIPTTTTTSIIAPGLTGIGATKASFTDAHGLSLGGCPARTCFGPTVATGAGTPYQFQLVTFGSGRIIGYTEAFAKETSIAEAQAKALAAFPSDTSVSHTGVIENDSAHQSCRWIDVSSATLGKVFQGSHKLSAASAKYLKSIGSSPDQMSIEFATDDASGNWTYNPGDINQAVISVGWHSGSNC